MRRKIKITERRKEKITLRQRKKKDNVKFINIGTTDKKSETNDKFY